MISAGFSLPGLAGSVASKLPALLETQVNADRSITFRLYLHGSKQVSVLIDTLLRPLESDRPVA
jgi:hypothetical protein